MSLNLKSSITLHHFCFTGYKQQRAAQYFIHAVPGTDSGGGVHPRQQHRHVPGEQRPLTVSVYMQI